MFACPKCASALTATVVDDGGGVLPEATVLACDGCGGVWLENEMTQQLVKGILAHRVFVVALAGDGGGRSGSARPYRDVPSNGCPMCHESLTRVITTQAVHGIDALELDICATHGTWFDAHELVTLDDALETKRMGDSKKAVRRAADLEAAVNAAYPQGLRTIAIALVGGRSNARGY